MDQDLSELMARLTVQEQDIDPIKVSLQDLFDEHYIKPGDILYYEKTIDDTTLTYQCKVINIIPLTLLGIHHQIKKNFEKRKLEVILTSENNMVDTSNSLTTLEYKIIGLLIDLGVA
ncbi:7738_t:CDS:2, partial [Funneliformis geosporum]